jgi:23S rRNA pseudouridine1911/1915/1917 synthase
VPSGQGGRPLDGLVHALFEVSWGKAREWIEGGKIAVDGEACTDTRAEVAAGAELVLDMNARRPSRRDELPADVLVYADAHVVVVNKPAGISTVPYEGDLSVHPTVAVRDALPEKVRMLVAKRDRRSGAVASLGVVHRLDKETTGLLVFTRTWLAKKGLASQFRAHTVGRRYLAIVHGEMPKRTIRTHLVEDRGDGLRGSVEAMRRPPRGGGTDGRLAITHVEPLERLNGATLVACRLETGRTHQIRIHLSEAGHPLVGERVYIRDWGGDRIAAPRIMLHAAELGFIHPATERPVRWEAPMPPDMKGVLERLRRK